MKFKLINKAVRVMADDSGASFSNYLVLDVDKLTTLARRKRVDLKLVERFLASLDRPRRPCHSDFDTFCVGDYEDQLALAAGTSGKQAHRLLNALFERI